MKTLTINLTQTDSVTLTYSESAQEWDLFDGNISLLDEMAYECGWDFQENSERLADWTARNKDIFVKEEKEVSTDELWNS